LFRAQADTARMMAGHVVLEGPSGQNTKQQMGLPYTAHSIVDPLKSASFTAGLKALTKAGLRPEDGFIAGSVSLLSQGMLGRESTDVDFVLNRNGRSRMRELGMSPSDNKGWLSFNEGPIEAWDANGHGAETAEEDYKKADSLHGWRIQRPSRALGLKAQLNRPKDRLDLQELGYRPAASLGRDYTTNEAGIAVPKHVTLETDSARRFIRPGLWGDEDPYNEHSTVNPFKAAYFTARDELRKTFKGGVLDTAIRKGVEYVATRSSGEYILDVANSAAQGLHEGLGKGIRKSPLLNRYANQFGGLGREFSEEGDFGAAWANVQREGAKMLGVDTEAAAKTAVNKTFVKASKFVLKNVMGPWFLTSLTFIPLVREIGSHLRHAYGRHVAKNLAEEHHNLETPTGRNLKDTMGLPYKTHSIVDMGKVVAFFDKVKEAFRTRVMPEIHEDHGTHAVEFKEVRDYVENLATKYPDLIGRPREFMRAVYDLQTSAYAYFAQHQNVYLSTFARTMLMAEKVEHILDYTYKFSPNRYGSKLFRAAVGATKRDYEHLAMQGISNVVEGVERDLVNANIRRFVRVGGVAIGLIETVFRYEHAHHDMLKYWHKFVRPERDPEQQRRDQLEKDRRRGYREARRKGQVYDPTLPARQHVGVKEASHLLEEIVEQMNPIAAAGRFVTAMKDPRRHIQSVSMYAAFGGYLGFTAMKLAGHFGGAGHGGHAAEHVVEEIFPRFSRKAITKYGYEFASLFMHNLGTGMQVVTGIGGTVGFVFGRSASARAGAFANLGATLVADFLGKAAGKAFIETKWGQKWAGQAYTQVSRIPQFLDIKNDFLQKRFDKAGETGKILYNAGTAEAGAVRSAAEDIAIREAKDVAGKVGMEVGGLILEGSLLIPFRKALRNFGQHLDKTAALRHARRIGNQLDKKDKEDRKARSRDDKDLRRYLSTFSAPAFSQADLMTNTDYSYVTRAALFAARRTDEGRALLDSVGSVVNRVRRFRSGVRAVFTTGDNNNRKREDWRMRLTRSYSAPAYSQLDIASNPQYNVAQRLGLAAFSHTERGEAVLERASPVVTGTRRMTAWMEGLTHPHEIGEHVVQHAVRHGHHAVRHVAQRLNDQAQGNGATAAAVDVLGTFSGAANDTARVVKDARRKGEKRKAKVKVRTNAASKDHALDERMLHNAYSRYINYGHEGDALSYSDQNQN
jgi:hypothetical protein